MFTHTAGETYEELSATASGGYVHHYKEAESFATPEEVLDLHGEVHVVVLTSLSRLWHEPVQGIMTLHLARQQWSRAG